MAELARQLALEKELKQLTAINKTVATLIATIQVTSADISKTNQTTHHTDKLLDKWIKILSQTHFTQRIISKPHWTGTSGISDEELESKIQEERTLLNSLEEMEAENEQLEQRIKSKELHEAQELQRKRENVNKRHRDLGLGNRAKLTTRDRRR
ncbi:DASH complex subunit DUO1 [[Candida] zeylanoides]